MLLKDHASPEDPTLFGGSPEDLGQFVTERPLGLMIFIRSAPQEQKLPVPLPPN